MCVVQSNSGNWKLKNVSPWSYLSLEFNDGDLTCRLQVRCMVILAKDLKSLWPCALFQSLEKAGVPAQLVLRAVLAFGILLLFPHNTYVLVVFMLVKGVIFGRNTRIYAACKQ